MEEAIRFDNKYLVLKWDDILEFLKDGKSSELEGFVEIINDGRQRAGKADNEYLVLKTTEPYAHTVAQIMKMYGHYGKDGEIVVQPSTEFGTSFFDNWPGRLYSINEVYREYSRLENLVNELYNDMERLESGSAGYSAVKEVYNANSAKLSRLKNLQLILNGKLEDV